jgi:hypothetical protein
LRYVRGQTGTRYTVKGPEKARLCAASVCR